MMITSRKTVVVAANLQHVIFDRIVGSSPLWRCSGHVTKPHRDVTSGVCGARHGPCLRLLDRRGTLVPRHLGRCLRLSWGCCLLQGFEALKDPLFLFIVLSL